MTIRMNTQKFISYLKTYVKSTYKVLDFEDSENYQNIEIGLKIKNEIGEFKSCLVIVLFRKNVIRLFNEDYLFIIEFKYFDETLEYIKREYSLLDEVKIRQVKLNMLTS